MWPFNRASAETTAAITEPSVPLSDVRRIVEDALDESVSSWEMALTQRGGAEGWTQVGGGARGGILPEHDRKALVRTSRYLTERDPLCKQIVRLWTNFGVGTGVTYRARNEAFQKAIDAFWNHPSNRKYFTVRGQRDLSNRLLKDGELPIAIFPGNPPVLRILDPLQISDIATAPDDEATETHFLREWTTRTGQVRQAWYRAIDNADDTPGEDGNGVPVRAGTLDNTIDDSERENRKGPLILFLRLEGIEGRGYPLLTPVGDWSKAHRQFMRARVSVMQAIATYAMKEKVKGGPAKVNQAVARAAAAEAARATTDAKKTGGRRVENEATNLSAMPQETGAAAAQVDGAMLLQMVGAGAGIFPHYFGAGEAFRLATATAMETPMLKTFEAYASDWVDTWNTIFQFVGDEAGISLGDERFVDIDMPDIYPSDSSATLASLIQAVAAFPQFKQSEAVQKLALILLGLNNADEIIEDLPEIPEPELGDPGQEPPAPGAGETRTAESAMVSDFLRTLKRLRETTREDREGEATDAA